MNGVMIGLLIIIIDEVSDSAYDFLMVCLVFVGFWDIIYTLYKWTIDGIMGMFYLRYEVY